MAEGTYEYECMRAELLGLDKPDYDEFVKKQQEKERKEVEDDDKDIEELKHIEEENDGIARVSGGLDELNSILKKTQTKIHRLKHSYTSITSIIKDKVGGRWSSQSSVDSDNVTLPENDVATKTEETPECEDNVKNENSNDPNEVAKSSRKSDLAKALDKDLNNLDSMIEKAENAQYSMNYQRKEIKKFLNK